MRELGGPPEPEGTFARTRLTRDVLLSRPWLLDLRQSTPPMGPRRLLWLDRALDALSGTGLDDGEKFNAATVLTGYALTDATLAHSLGAGGEELTAGTKGATEYGEILAEVLDPATYPALSAMMRSGLLRNSTDWTEDADFRFGLDLLLDGIEALITRRAVQRR